MSLFPLRPVGCWLGELADTLSEERRRQLKEHQEREGQSTEGTSATGDGEATCALKVGAWP